jgi:hypothetical protein
MQEESGKFERPLSDAEREELAEKHSAWVDAMTGLSGGSLKSETPLAYSASKFSEASGGWTPGTGEAKVEANDHDLRFRPLSLETLFGTGSVAARASSKPTP